MNRLYSASPDGYCGDEDNGQTSAWYVFSALGFYPVCPASDEYVLGAPLFKRAEISLPDGKKVKITAENIDNTDEPLETYIKNMKVDGRNWKNNYLRHSELTDGASLEFRMQDTPNYKRGTKAKNRPYSFSKEKDC
jgi:putative alpha-1,2-mannosidase